jgi:hypothetical protein
VRICDHRVTMKVLDLRCANGHVFEGWFAGEDDFLAQNGARRIECPLCGDSVIVKAPTAARLNLGAREVLPQPVAAATPPSPDAPRDPTTMPQAMQAAWMRAVRHVLATTEDVGPRFAEEARRIHYGESDMRGIRGKTTERERDALRDEGIEFATLPLPEGLDGPMQ